MNILKLKSLFFIIISVIIFQSNIQIVKANNCIYFEKAIELLGGSVKNIYQSNQIKDCCTFDGVNCELKNNENYITKIIFKNGQFATNSDEASAIHELSNLQYLTYLTLDSNYVLEGYIPILSNLVDCKYGLTNLCNLKGAKCFGNGKKCSLEDIRMSNKENGNPNSESKEFNNLAYDKNEIEERCLLLSVKKNHLKTTKNALDPTNNDYNKNLNNVQSSNTNNLPHPSTINNNNSYNVNIIPPSTQPIAKSYPYYTTTTMLHTEPPINSNPYYTASAPPPPYTELPNNNNYYKD